MSPKADCPALDYALVLCSELDGIRRLLSFPFLRMWGAQNHRHHLATEGISNQRIGLGVQRFCASRFLFFVFCFSAWVIFSAGLFSSRLRFVAVMKTVHFFFFLKADCPTLYIKKNLKIWIESDKWTEYLMSRIAQHLWLCFRPPQPTVSVGLKLCWNNPVSTGF